MTADRREMAAQVRPLGTGKDARLRDLWTVLETVAWIASRDIQLVSGVSRYEPRVADFPNLREGARHNAIRMDIEEGFCLCGGSPSGSSKFPPPHCRCLPDAERLLLDSCGRGELVDRSPNGGPDDREAWRDARFLKNGGVVFPARPNFNPLFRRKDVEDIWRQNRQNRRKAQNETAVSVDELVVFLRTSGDVGRRKALALAKAAFPGRWVKDKAIREACLRLSPNKAPGRPTAR